MRTVSHASQLSPTPPDGTVEGVRIGAGQNAHVVQLAYDSDGNRWLGLKEFHAIRGKDWPRPMNPATVFAPDLQTQQYWTSFDDLWAFMSPALAGQCYAAGLSLEYRQDANLHDLNWDGSSADFRGFFGAYLYAYDHGQQTHNYDTPPPTWGWAECDPLVTVPGGNRWWRLVWQDWRPLVPFVSTQPGVTGPPVERSIYSAVYGYMQAGAVTSATCKDFNLWLRWVANLGG